VSPESPLSNADHVRGDYRKRGSDTPQQSESARANEEARSDAIPGSPAKGPGGEIGRAAERVDELRAEGPELHLAFDDKAGRVQIEVRDLDGNVLRTIPPSTALSVVAGDTPD
jgi:uncharacterized FlaG/YvyC family protein